MTVRDKRTLERALRIAAPYLVGSTKNTLHLPLKRSHQHASKTF
jgi:hypothetical protein